MDFKSLTISITIFSTLLFFFSLSPSFPPPFLTPTTLISSTPPQVDNNNNNRLLLTHPTLLNITNNNNNNNKELSNPIPSCSSILELAPAQRCAFATARCRSGLLNYYALHFCRLPRSPQLSVPILALLLLSHFYFLVKTAQDRFSPVVTKLSSTLRLSPTTGAVTLLALGNGAPDVFASLAAVRSGRARTGLGAILSAGTFVSALVVGLVAIHAAPFPLDPAPFVRDVFFYLLSAFALFYVYLTAEIFLWQALAFVAFYFFFVALVFWMDVIRAPPTVDDAELALVVFAADYSHKGFPKPDSETDVLEFKTVDKSDTNLCWGALRKVSRLWEVPVLVLLKLTIPSTAPSEWNRFYISANITLCPLLMLYSCNSFIPFNHKIVFLVPHFYFPLWSVVLFICFLLGLLHYVIEKGPPETEEILPILVAFVMSVFWISTVAGELMDCLAAVGAILELPPSLLGMTVLAWGNSVGDLVSDVAVAKAGQPAMAMAGCFAGPMFNMLVGLGGALVIQTADVYPRAYELQFNLGIVLAFVFLFLSLMGSLLVVTWSRFRVPRFWGFCLVGLYVLFIAVSLIVAKVSG